jgi:ABC-type bacteriocin/lantibiotic exporter with double-glycine peptidase domain
MVLSAWGVDIDIDEARLRDLSDCSPFGTNAFQLVEAARTLGFTASRKHTLASIDELAHLANSEVFPIVYVDLWPIKGGLSGQYHSLVVLSVDAESVLALDPMEGERRLSRVEFMAVWAEMRFLTIVIDR